MTIESRSTVRQSKEEYKRERRNTVSQRKGETRRVEKGDFPLEMVTDDLSSGWRRTPMPEIITHSDDKVNGIDLNVLWGDVPSVGKWCI